MEVTIVRIIAAAFTFIVGFLVGQHVATPKKKKKKRNAKSQKKNIAPCGCTDGSECDGSCVFLFAYCFECEIEMPTKEKNGQLFCTNCGLRH